ncbi:hypothetical protein [Serratia fonticola]|uniref:hypothetical protein n=1 Tax=Serratia fonticola TaxID=47917 RepID=UPI000E0E9C60|nr:hypothetical protein [Serratia fonticola]RDL16457.1 hypothetical protein DFO62_12035 [Serratia fonticola]
MNSIYTIKCLTEKQLFASRNWYYHFREVSNFFSDKECTKVANDMANKYSIITKVWSVEKNSEWICRHYLSSKMIMSATLNLNTMLYSKDKNIRLTLPYLKYYTLLSLFRGIVYTLPHVLWDDGGVITLSHKKIIQYVFEYLSKFNKEKALMIKEIILDAKANRELITYRSPTSGDALINDHLDIVEMSALLSDLIQFNTELMESSVIKNSDESALQFMDKYISKVEYIRIGDKVYRDKEDGYRLGYVKRKFPLPVNALHLMTEGHVEDFFGAWWVDPDEIEGEVFDPDDNWSLIFDIP